MKDPKKRYVGYGTEDGTNDRVKVYGATPEEVRLNAAGSPYRIRLTVIYDTEPSP